MANSTATATASVSFPIFSITFVVLLVLKLAGIASISWWWVFSPLIIGFVITLLMIALAIFIVVKS